MQWNWQLPDWPHFNYHVPTISSMENKFLQGMGGTFAVLKHLNHETKKQFIVEILSEEGFKSAEIEGEILERESLQSSIQRHFSLNVNDKPIPAQEQGMGDLMWTMYNTYDQELTHVMLYEWHRLIIPPHSRVSDWEKYRTHTDPMQIVSGRYDRKTVYFEAPPSKQVFNEMDRFIKWFNAQKSEPSILANAAIAHVYFESIHPFEDGNGRIGRALVEKILSQSLNKPTLIAISKTIHERKKEYYKELGLCNRTLNVSKWVSFFSQVVIESQEESLSLVHFLISKSKMMNELQGKINDRQKKVLLRMYDEGLKGFSGELSAENYISITKTSRATATRDLNDLVQKNALVKTGQLRHTRYRINI